MHSHTKGEKLDNIKRNSKVGFEVDRNLEFLPSYFFDPNDASLADTLYISVVIKGDADMIDNAKEKIIALNALMKKYQPEGNYSPMTENMKVLDAVAVIKIIPNEMNGKYKIGQNMSKQKRMELAENILKKNSKTALDTLEVMGFTVNEGKPVLKIEEEW